MNKNIDIVSELINDLRLLNIDEHISRRFVLYKAKQKAKHLIAQKLLDRTLSHEYNIFSDVNCFELELIDKFKCSIVEFKSCNKLMKSKHALPEPIYSRLGSSVKEVTNIDGSIELKPINLDQYRRNKKRQIKDTVNIFYYIGTDEHLYVPIENNIEIEVVNLKYITTEPEKIIEVEGCDNKDKCKSGWEYPFIIPHKLYQAVYKDCLNELSSIFRQIQPDENPNMNANIRN